MTALESTAEVAGGRCLVVDLGRAGPVRSMVGPTAWFVLEELAGAATSTGSRVEVEGNARDFAVEVGLSKDTVARALRRLAAAGLVRRVDRRSARTGRFASTTYVVDLSAAGLRVATVSDRPAVAASDTVAPAPPSAVELDASAAQLSFLT